MRSYLLVLLVLLQMIAPLVHAHSGTNFSSFGLHLPNFEIYSATNQIHSSCLQSADDLISVDNATVSISTGIQNQADTMDDLPSLLYFPPEPLVFCVALISCEINFSPQTPQSTKTFSHLPQSPRAPPFSV